MSTTTITTTAALRSRALSDAVSPFVVPVGVNASWRDRMPNFSAAAGVALRQEPAVAPVHAVRVADSVPATQTGRGIYADTTPVNSTLGNTQLGNTTLANTKQDRPPRGVPR